ncbi:hypothetical protein LYSBPC_27010 [Lysinibacillus piscis]|uniref:Uncharacterized protein n=1 Tax=Lysinibacillus piscis TaxID=2518931 RepID=A0ABQ5NML9_9BACI|nr:hypothetical protein LYSBPC_27010 [Lysinibacillus sp. KH24]
MKDVVAFDVNKGKSTGIVYNPYKYEFRYFT